MSLEELLPDPAPPSTTQVVHFYVATTIPWPGVASRLMLWGDVVEITPLLRELGRDRNGSCWVDIAGDPEAQLNRWGRVRYALGPWPVDLPRYEPGSQAEQEAIQDAYRNAWAIPTEVERLAALAEVRATWGAPTRTSKTIMTYGNS